MEKKNNRKNEHVSLAEHFYTETHQTDFDHIRFVHHSIPETGTQKIDLSTSFAGLSMTQPFYINAMTGGSSWTKKVNEKLATVARETGLLMASGSLSAGLKDPSVADSFTIIRETNPNGQILANLGGGQTLENAKKAINLIQANGLQIHLNTPQEIVMPEGDRDFSSWLTKLEQIVKGVDVPVIVKEVGFGMSRETMQQLASIGVKTIDVSGKGGTNFAQIENYRRTKNSMDFLEDWGQSTAISLLEAQPLMGSTEILASGGIRTQMDILKSLSLGAHAAGISGYFLHYVLQHGVDETIAHVEQIKEQLVAVMTLLGAESVADLQKTDLIITGPVRDWCEARDIDYRSFARRNQLFD
ncbi:type 2 isopentenyl-diphosphate Delta-isomerase [Desemzia sp. RIT804]|uniref:type 2 isopentenyl-diphosphate Delta-isomerase n=1 Tax=Desemzia sp. RIT 804 TaxID=2810209 RepID=UPI00194E91D7|nr:type 2 isopentenyl-diphosphate Delta-isomerase [Desemzia sp. RIT 804]MBM6614591.1 type 2 isopentenyl-diphosphate Delta-isomerase [Desemzia sp. RIT 804]